MDESLEEVSLDETETGNRLARWNWDKDNIVSIDLSYEENI